MHIKKSLALGLISVLPLAACTSTSNTTTEVEDTSTQVTTTISVDYSTNDLDTTYDEATVEKIAFNETSISSDGALASINGSTLTLSAAGDYLISGSLSDGQILIAADKEDVIHIFFNNVSITNKEGSPFVFLNADKVVVTLLENTVNTLIDGSSYTLNGDEDPDATIYAKDDLTINGLGTLNVTSNTKNGIHGSNDIKIIDASVNVTAAKDGIKAKDRVSLKDAQLLINADNDGIQATNDVDQGLGTIDIDGGVITIIAGLDGIQAETQVLISDGIISIDAGSKAGTNDSGKGIKAILDLTIDGGTLDITSQAEDTLNSKGTLTISAGTLKLSAQDDAITANETLLINGGDINISTSYEGLESAEIIINDGTIHLLALDDGINTSTDTVDYVKGGTNMTQDDGSSLTITGGSIFVNALGDGVDSNGSITMTGGTLIAYGPTASQNGTLDYNNSFTLTGGTIIAVGSSGMAQQASVSEINTVMVNLSSTLPSGTLITVVDSNGDVVLSFETIKSAANFVYASESLVNGTYTVYSGGSLDTSLVDHVSTSGTYTKGTQLTTFTIASTITSSGAVQSGPGGGGTRPPKK
jgi:hypothetical protein